MAAGEKGTGGQGQQQQQQGQGGGKTQRQTLQAVTAAIAMKMVTAAWRSASTGCSKS
jgi:hypothetical protein